MNENEWFIVVMKFYALCAVIGAVVMAFKKEKEMDWVVALFIGAVRGVLIGLVPSAIIGLILAP